MKPRTVIPLILLIFSASTLGGREIFSSSSGEAADGNLKRIRFHIAAVEESAGMRTQISEANVEGAPGTDFSINLQASHFKMNASFLTDLISPEMLKIRANLNTRRLYGYSEKNLPLYEEDSQNQTLDLGFDEEIVLLPFGRNGGGEQLKIQITPSLTDESVHLPSGKLRPITIAILEASKGGAIEIRASTVPHKFEVETALIENGREIARKTETCLIAESHKIELQPEAGASSIATNNPLVINLTIDGYERRRPSDEASLSFDAHRIDRQNGDQRAPVALKWAGIVGIGLTATYDLTDHYLSTSGNKYELRFRVKLPPGDQPINSE